MRDTYKSIYNNSNNFSYDECFLNDLTKWMNHDISLNVNVSRRYLKIMRKALKISGCDSILDILSCESFYTSRKLCQYYFLSLNDFETKKFQLYCLRR